MVRFLISVAAALCGCAHSVSAQILEDKNGDGAVEVLAFGDSITYGVGDGIEPGEYVLEITDLGRPRGWPLRLSSLLGVSVLNAGVPGEGLSEDGSETGVQRFAGVVVGSSADVVVIKEGTNDAQRLVSDSQYRNALQKVINTARADNKNVVVATLAAPLGLREQYAPFTGNLSMVIRDVAAYNLVPVVDIEALFYAGCPVYAECAYYNRPEGLHPNTLGYDVIAAEMARVLQAG